MNHVLFINLKKVVKYHENERRELQDILLDDFENATFNKKALKVSGIAPNTSSKVNFELV
jgi:hypothetical protein